MRRRAIRTPAARLDLVDYISYFAQTSKPTAKRFRDAARRTFGDLVRLPGLGEKCETRNQRLAGLRVWPIRGFDNHLVFYREVPEGIEIVRVIHGARNIERILER